MNDSQRFRSSLLKGKLGDPKLSRFQRGKSHYINNKEPSLEESSRLLKILSHIKPTVNRSQICHSARKSFSYKNNQSKEVSQDISIEKTRKKITDLKYKLIGIDSSSVVHLESAKRRVKSKNSFVSLDNFTMRHSMTPKKDGKSKVCFLKTISKDKNSITELKVTTPDSSSDKKKPYITIKKNTCTNLDFSLNKFPLLTNDNTSERVNSQSNTHRKHRYSIDTLKNSQYVIPCKTERIHEKSQGGIEENYKGHCFNTKWNSNDNNKDDSPRKDNEAMLFLKKRVHTNFHDINNKYDDDDEDKDIGKETVPPGYESPIQFMYVKSPDKMKRLQHRSMQFESKKKVLLIRSVPRKQIDYKQERIKNIRNLDKLLSVNILKKIDLTKRDVILFERSQACQEIEERINNIVSPSSSNQEIVTFPFESILSKLRKDYLSDISYCNKKNKDLRLFPFKVNIFKRKGFYDIRIPTYFSTSIFNRYYSDTYIFLLKKLIDYKRKKTLRKSILGDSQRYPINIYVTNQIMSYDINSEEMMKMKEIEKVVSTMSNTALIHVKRQSKAKNRIHRTMINNYTNTSKNKITPYANCISIKGVKTPSAYKKMISVIDNENNELNKDQQQKKSNENSLDENGSETIKYKKQDKETGERHSILRTSFFSREDFDMDRLVQLTNDLELRPIGKIKNLNFRIVDEQEEIKKNKNMSKESLAFRTQEIKMRMKDKLETIEEILFFLIKEANFKEFKKIIEKFQISIESRDKYNNTFLIYAVECSFMECIVYLLQKGANINCSNVNEIHLFNL